MNTLKRPKNLHKDTRGRPDYWRYRRPDGTYKTFQASSTEEAYRLAEEANAQRHLIQPPAPAPVSALSHWIDDFIKYREQLDPRLPEKQSWKNRCAALRQLSKVFGDTPLFDLTLPMLRAWWDSLSAHSQSARRPEYNKLFNYLLTHGVVRLDSNPFTKMDDRPRVLNKVPPPKQRRRLTQQQYDRIHALAPDWLQLAMDLSLYTTMRRGDICALRFDTHVIDGGLQKEISKAAAKGRSVVLRWEFSEHPELKKLIDDARQRAFKLHASPFIVSRKPKHKNPSRERSHYAQTLPDNITKAFKKTTASIGIKNTSFHEIRSLAAHNYGETYDLDSVRELMAHTDEEMTRYYQAGHKLTVQRIHIRPK